VILLADDACTVMCCVIVFTVVHKLKQSSKQVSFVTLSNVLVCGKYLLTYS